MLVCELRAEQGRLSSHARQRRQRRASFEGVAIPDISIDRSTSIVARGLFVDVIVPTGCRALCVARPEHGRTPVAHGAQVRARSQFQTSAPV